MREHVWDNIVNLTPFISLDDFCCGEPEIDLWLQRDALDWQECGACQVYVALQGTVIVGFFTLTSYHLQHRVVPDSVDVPGNVPVILLGRFGIDQRFRGSNRMLLQCAKQGPLLLKAAMLKACEAAQLIGCRLLYVDALNDSLIPWYAQQGFVSLPKSPRKMVFDLHKLMK